MTTKYIKATATSKAIAKISNEDAVLRLVLSGIKEHDAVRNTIAHCLKHGNYASLTSVGNYLTKSTGKAQWVGNAKRLVSFIQANEAAVKTATAVCRKDHIGLDQCVVLVEWLAKRDDEPLKTALTDAAQIEKVLPTEAPAPKKVAPVKATTKKMIDLTADDAEFEQALAALRAAREAKSANPSQLAIF